MSTLVWVSGAADAAELTVSVMLPHSPVLFEAVISVLPSALATATQKVIICSTATMSGLLEVTMYSAPLGPMMRPLRSPTSRVLPL